MDASSWDEGAHQQPWTFLVVRNAALKVKIRMLIEAEEKRNYARRMKQTWIDAINSSTGILEDERLLAAEGVPAKPYVRSFVRSFVRSLSLIHI